MSFFIHKTKSIQIGFTFIFLLLLSCSTPLLASPSAVSIVTPIETLIAAIQATKTPAFIAIDFGQPANPIQEQCVEIKEGFPSNNLMGSILLKNPVTYKGLLFDSKTQQMIPYLKDSVVWDVAVSPDNKKTALYVNAFYANGGDPNTDYLYITDSHGEVQNKIPLPEGWKGGLERWLDNENILIAVRHKEEGFDFATTPFPLARVNVNSGQKEMLFTDFPDIYSVDTHRPFYLSQTVFNPALEYVLYAAGNDRAVLWDYVNNLQIASIMVGFGDGPPKWSPSGEQFVINDSLDLAFAPRFGPIDELFLGNMEGELTRISYLASKYETIEFISYDWSPNGSYISFWAWVSQTQTIDHSIGPQLMILDIQTKQVVNLCNPAKYLMNEGYFCVSPPVWSPDSKYILIGNSMCGNPEITAPPTAFLIDFDSYQAYKIATDYEPVGWLLP